MEMKSGNRTLKMGTIMKNRESTGMAVEIRKMGTREKMAITDRREEERRTSRKRNGSHLQESLCHHLEYLTDHY